MPVHAHLGLYHRKTWLYFPPRVCTCPFLLVWACTPGKPGCAPLDKCALARSCPLGSVRPGNLSVCPLTSVHVSVRARLGLYARETWLYVPGHVFTCPFAPVWACTPGKFGCTPLDAWERGGSCTFVPVRP